MPFASEKQRHYCYWLALEERKKGRKPKWDCKAYGKKVNVEKNKTIRRKTKKKTTKRRTLRRKTPKNQKITQTRRRTYKKKNTQRRTKK